jgi:hypothetical protein
MTVMSQQHAATTGGGAQGRKPVEGAGGLHAWLVGRGPAGGNWGRKQPEWGQTYGQSGRATWRLRPEGA